MTNRWIINKIAPHEIFIMREADEIPICKMIVSVEDGDKLLNPDEALDVAQQIIDEWNFSCDELENNND